MADSRLWHSWPERLSRIYLPLVFFFFYRYVLIASKDFYARRRTEQNHRILSGQMSALEGYSRLMQKSGEQLSVLRHDLRHNYRIIHAMLENGELAKARETVAAELAKLKNAQPVSYANAPLLSAMLSIYIHRAEEMGCRVNARVDLPDRRIASENDLALLMSNVLIHAAKAGEIQPKGKREMMFTLRIAHGKGTLELMNRHEQTFPLDERGWPLEDPRIDENGLGLLSLTAFVKKYKAHAFFYQRDGWVRLSLAWEEQSP